MSGSRCSYPTRCRGPGGRAPPRLGWTLPPGMPEAPTRCLQKPRVNKCLAQGAPPLHEVQPVGPEGGAPTSGPPISRPVGGAGRTVATVLILRGQSRSRAEKTTPAPRPVRTPSPTPAPSPGAPPTRRKEKLWSSGGLPFYWHLGAARSQGVWAAATRRWHQTRACPAC